jgi:hypothetical protein
MRQTWQGERAKLPTAAGTGWRTLALAGDVGASTVAREMAR